MEIKKEDPKKMKTQEGRMAEVQKRTIPRKARKNRGDKAQ